MIDIHTDDENAAAAADDDDDDDDYHFLCYTFIISISYYSRI